MNQSNLEGKWKEIKGEIKTMWGNLTGDDLEKTKGNVDSIVGLIQQKYGTAKDEISEKVKGLFSKYEGDAIEKKDSVLKTAADQTEAAKDKLRN
jgi:uncharacterized protein YjbJ (UPF0337 family)